MHSICGIYYFSFVTLFISIRFQNVINVQLTYLEKMIFLKNSTLHLHFKKMHIFLAKTQIV
jgi:hypothetical protein